ncbi:MAG: hypothetical protein WC343_03400 [Bacilli bacterium]|jgi:hypothetical protein
MTKGVADSKTVKAALAVVLLGIVTILQGGEFVPSAEFIGAVMILLGAIFAILRKYTDEALSGWK